MDSPQFVFHITTGEQWQDALTAGAYRGDTLDTQGFVHCSTAQQVTRVADALYRGQAGLVLLCIDTQALAVDLRYEPPDEADDNGELFPHVYGPLNVEAVAAVVDFPPGADGNFTLPERVAAMR